MPPRLSTLTLPLRSNRSSVFPIASYLLPFLQTHNRSASILSSLSDNPTAYSKKIRRGRGPSSGKGKTSGRGHKGQKQHGKVPRDFNGGQTPLEIVHGIRGQVNVFSVDMTPLNLDRLQSWVDQGRLDPTHPITIKELCESNCVANITDGVKLLARNASTLRSPLHIVISRASASAIAAVEAVGGSVMTRFYTPSSIRRVIRGTADPVVSLRSERLGTSETLEKGKGEGEMGLEAEQEGHPNKGYLHRLPDPTSRKDIEYYRDPAHRGYLSHLVPEGEGPSLFWRTPGPGRAVLKKHGLGTKKVAGENRIW